MVDFSKVSRQLFITEAPFNQDGSWAGDEMPNAPQKRGGVDLRQFQKPGERGRRFEKKVAGLLNHLSPRDDNKISGENHRQLGGRMKADIMNDDGVGYSVKTKMNNDDPMKVQQSSFPSTLWSKLQVPWKDRAMGDQSDFAEQIKGNKLAQALVMRFGSQFGSLNRVGGLIRDELNPDQKKMLQKFHKDNGDQDRIGSNPFLTNEEMFDTFPEHYEALLNHLDDNKLGIFNSLVRQSGGEGGDQNPIQRFVSHITNEGVNGGVRGVDENGEPIYDFSGKMDVHDMSDETVQTAMDKLKWFGSGDRFYMAEQETDDINQRLIDLWPYDEEGTSWALRPGDGNRQNEITPGFFKAMMSADPELLERLFPSILRGEIQFDPQTNRNSFVNLNNNKVESMDFNKLHFGETLEVEKSTSEKAMQSGQVQNDKRRLQRQKDQMAQKSRPAAKSDVVYASEEYFKELRHSVEHRKAQDSARYNWRDSIEEAAVEKPQDEGDHPYVDVMPHTHKLPKKPHGNTKPENRPELDQTMGEETIMEISVGKALAAGRKSRRKAEKSGDPHDRKKAVETTNRALRKRDKRDAAYFKSMQEQESTSFCEAFDNLVEKELSIDQQMKMAREAGKNRNPNPDHRAIRARQLAKAPKVKDNRTDSEKMADAYASPRKGPGGAVRAD